jgi:hypothetical protein
MFCDAPAYELAKLVSDAIKYELPLPYTFNVKNSFQLMTELHDCLLDNQHTLHSMEDSMTLLYNTKKGRMLNCLEKFHMYKENKNGY